MAIFAPHLPASVAHLQPFVEAGVFGPAEVQVAAAVDRLARSGGTDATPHPHVLLAVAVATRAPALGHVGIELAAVGQRMLDRNQQDLVDLPWPDGPGWIAILEASPLVASPSSACDEPVRPLVWDGRRIYLQRYWMHEQRVAEDVRARAAAAVGELSPSARSVLDAVFPAPFADGPTRQHEAAVTALRNRLSVIAGGPGTGKTYTIARLLAAELQAARDRGVVVDVALAAPTGKAAARMTEALRGAVAELREDALAVVGEDALDRLAGLEAGTIHRLLGWRPGGRFRHDRHEPLPHDLIVVDETSMVSLPLMDDLLAAVRPDSRVVLVGDPDQLASVDAGTVLGDLVGPARAVPPASGEPWGGPLVGRVAVLDRAHRFGEGSGIGQVAGAIRAGDVDSTIRLLEDHPDLTWVRPDDAVGVGAVEAQVVEAAEQVVRAALAGDAAAGLAAATSVKVLAATRRGPNSLQSWADVIQAAVRSRVPGLAWGTWYVGRPVLVTSNDRGNRVWNGDTGLTVAGEGGMVVAIPEGSGIRRMPTARLGDVETWWAMTIHKSQGSEFDHVVVALPSESSPILTRELLYTAATRARRRLTIVSSEAALRTALSRPVARASGLRGRLWGDEGS